MSYNLAIRDTFTTKKKEVLKLLLNWNSTQLVSVSHDKVLRIWDVSNGSLKLVDQCKGSFNIIACCYSKSETKIYYGGGYNYTISMYDLNKKKKAKLFQKCHSYNIRDLKITKNGKVLASASYDNTIKLWNPKNLTQLATYNHPGDVRWVTFNPSDEDVMLACTSVNNSIYAWNRETLERCGSLIVSDFSTTSRFIVFTKNKQYVCWGADTKYIGANKVESNNPFETTLVSSAGVTSRAFCMAFSPNENILAIGHANGAISLWEFPVLNMIITRQIHTKYVRSLVFSTNNKYLFSCSSDGNINILDVTDPGWESYKAEKKKLKEKNKNSIIIGNNNNDSGDNNNNNDDFVETIVNKVEPKVIIKQDPVINTEVSRYLKEIGLEEYSENLDNANIKTMEQLKTLIKSDENLKIKLNILKIGHVKRLQKKVRDMIEKEDKLLNSDVSIWLDSIKIGEYKKNFIDANITTLDQLKTLDESFIKGTIKIEKTGHVKKVLLHIRKLNNGLYAPPKPEPVKPKYENEVIEFLHEIGLEEYIPNFKDEGLDSMDEVFTLSDDDLKNYIKMTKLGHRKKFLSSIKSKMNVSSENENEKISPIASTPPNNNKPPLPNKDYVSDDDNDDNDKPPLPNKDYFSNDEGNNGTYNAEKLNTMKISELKAILNDLSVDFADCIEKKELINKILENQPNNNPFFQYPDEISFETDSEDESDLSPPPILPPRDHD